MKRIYFSLAGALMILVVPQLRSADALTEALQKGLFEEEANQNLDAAIKAYQDVLSRADEQRRVAATALFRLAECYRKQGKTNEAAGEFRRLLRDYADQTTLVNLSRQNLTGLGLAAPGVTTVPGESAVSTDEEEREIRRIKVLIKDSPDLINARNQEVYRIGTENPRIINGTVLHQAAYKGHLQVASYLLANGSDPNARSTEDYTPLFYAAQNGHRNMAELLLTKGALPNVGASTSIRGTPLHAASSKGFRAVADVLLAHKADVNATDGVGKTPLHAAVEAGFQPVAELLISKGADVNALYALPFNPPSQNTSLTRIDIYDGTPLHFAVQRNNAAMALFLLEKGANVEARSGAGLTPLHYTAHNNTDAKGVIAGLLLQNKADVNAQGASESRFAGWTPLHMAVFHRATNLVRLVLEKGANPNLMMENAKMDYRTALQNAVAYSDRSIAELLLKHKADVNERDFHGFTPLLRAAGRNDAAMVEVLLAHDADLKATDSSGITPLVLAVRDDRIRVAELLLGKGADPNTRNPGGASLLALAMDSQIKQVAPRPFAIPPPGPAVAPPPEPIKTMVELLIDHKADVNAPLSGEATANTPLQHAVVYNKTNWVRLFLEKGANPNLPMPDPRTQARTLLHLAVQQQSILFADLLLRHGADVNGLDDHRRAPIFEAIGHKNTNMVNLLLRHSADLTAVLDDGTTPLLRAVEVGNVVMAKQLLAKGANPNATNDAGHTALHIALGAKEHSQGVQPSGGLVLNPGVAYGQSPPNRAVPGRAIRSPAQPSDVNPNPASKNRSLVELLLDYKANPDLRDRQGHSPLSLAVRKFKQDEVAALLAHKADPQIGDFNGNTALHLAARSGNVQGAELLVAHKANLNSRNGSGETALHLAATLNGFTNLIAFLIEKGADVNACDNSGDTPLHKALRASFNNSDLQKEALQALLDHGADVRKSCDDKPSPFDYVRVNKNSYAEWFRKYHPKKLARVDLTGPVSETLWYWDAKQKQTLSQVIAAVGLREKANPRNIRVLRDDPETRLKRELTFDLEAIREKRVPDVPMQDNDKIIVAER